MSGLDVTRARRATTHAARRAGNSRWMDRWARVGIAARGVLYGLIGIIAIQLAGGNQHRTADQKGAFQTLAGEPGGKAMLWGVAIGLFGYAIWQGTEAIWGHRQQRGRKRVAKRVESAARALIYLLIGGLAVKIVTGSPSRTGGDTATAKALKMTGGRALVIVVGLILVAVGARLAWQGVKSDFVKQLNLAGLSRRSRKLVIGLGRFGYVARGLVFALAGALVVAAAVTFDPAKARGLDAALRTLAGQPYGPWLLGAAALGLMCFGVYCFADARLRRI